jgi:transposase
VNRKEKESKKTAPPNTSKQASAFIDRPKVNVRRERIDMMDVLDRRMKLYRSGLSDTQIAKIEGSHRNTVCNWRRRRRLPPNTGKEAEA